MGLKTRTVKVIKRHLVHGKKCVGAKGFQGLGQKGVMCSPQPWALASRRFEEMKH